MSHSKTKKFVSGFVALALALSIALSATAVQALTAADIDLLAALGIISPDKVAAAKAALGATSGSGSVMTGGYVFATDLRLGSRGQDVWNLQKTLNSSSDTQIAATGPGSPGNETQYFGPATRAAVKKFQSMKGVPSTGYVGPLTRAELNKSVAVNPPPPSPNPSPNPIPAGTGLTVASATQPAQTLAPQGAARLPFTRFTLTAGNDGDVVVSSVTVQRTGLSHDAVFSGIVLLGEDGTQIGIARTFGSDHRATVGESFTVKRGTTVTLTIAGNMAADLSSYAGEVPALSVVAVNTSAAVSGSLPITGAAQVTNATLSLGSVTAARGPSDPNGAQTKNVGDTGVTFSAVRLTAGSQEKVRVHSVRWNQASSAGASDLANVKTYVDGVAYETMLSADGKYYTSKFGDGIVVDKGLFVEIVVKGDIIGGSGRTAAFNIEKTTDIYLTGETYGYGITPPTTGTGITAGSIWYAASTFTINTGSITVENATSVSAQNIAVNQASQPLGGYRIDVKGEPITVASHVFTVATTGTRVAGSDASITNVTIVDENGRIVAGPIDATGTGATLTFSDTVLYPVGKHTYTIKGKVGTGFGNNGTVIISTTPSTGWTTVVGQVTSKTITPSPSSSFSLNTMTAKSAALSISAQPNPASQTVVAGANNLTVAKILLDATASGEDVKLNSLQLDTAVNSSTSNITKCVLYDGTSPIQSGSNELTSFSNSSTTNFTFDNPLIIARGVSKTIDLKCTFNSSASGTYRFGFSSTASPSVTGVTSGQSATITKTTSVAGLLTFATSGTLAVTLDSSSPSFALTAGGTTGQTVSAFRIEGTAEDIRINEIALQLPQNATTTPSDLVGVTIWDGTTKIAEKSFSPGSLFASTTLGTCTGCSELIIPRDSYKIVTVKADFAAQGPNQLGIPGAVIAVDYDGTGVSSEVSGGISGTGLGSGVKINAAGSDTTSSGVRIFRSFPTVASVALPSATLSGATRDLFRFSVTASPKGDVGIYHLTFRISTSSGSSAAVRADDFNVYAYTDSGFNTAASGLSSQNDGSFLGTNLNKQWKDSTTDIVIGAQDSSAASTTAVVPAGQTRYFALKANTLTVTGTGNSISTTLQGDARFYAAVPRPYNVTGSQPSGVTTTLLATTTLLQQNNNGDFVWRPFSTTTTQNGAANDYANGYGIVGLPSVSSNPQTVSN